MSYAGLLARTSYLGRYPELSSTTIAAMAIGSALLAPPSIVLHELGHALQARREGLRADKITLWGLGGVAWIGTPRSPATSLRVIAAGPLVSALLAVLLGALGWLEARAGLPDPVVGVTVLVAQFNAVSFAFNLLPAFPMDGGRILHAALWRLQGPAFAWAWAVRAGIRVEAGHRARRQAGDGDHPARRPRRRAAAGLRRRASGGADAYAAMKIELRPAADELTKGAPRWRTYRRRSTTTVSR